MKHVPVPLRIMICFAGIAVLQLYALDFSQILQDTISYDVEKAKPNFLNVSIGIGFGENSQGLVFVVENNGRQELWLEGLQRNTNGIFLEMQGKYADLRLFSGPGKYYNAIPEQKYAIEYQSFKVLRSFGRNLWKAPFVTVAWIFSGLNNQSNIGISKVFLINAKVDKSYDFTSRFDDPDAVNLKIAKVINDDNGYNFAFIISNNTANDIEIDEFLGENTRIKIRFPDGKEFAFPRNAEAKKVTLAAGKSMYQFFDLKKVLEENPGWSLDNLKYGISQLALEVLPGKGELRSFSLPLVKFNQEPPSEPDYGRYRSLIKSPPTKEIFENNSFTLMGIYEQMGEKTRLFRP